jgi:CRISPR-associated protein Cas2
MAVNKHFYLVCFDIVKDRTRYKSVKVLLSYGRRVQKSVFECLLTDREYLEMKSKLDVLIDKTVDSIRYYHLCVMCAKNVEISGLGAFSISEEVIVI